MGPVALVFMPGLWQFCDLAAFHGAVWEIQFRDCSSEPRRGVRTQAKASQAARKQT